MSSVDLSRQRCHNHASREAVVKCPNCTRFFCRECVTDFHGRMLCTSCLLEVSKPKQKMRVRFGLFVRLAQLCAATFLLWLFFYLLGSTILAIPTKYHDTTVWKEWTMKEMSEDGESTEE